MKPIHRHRRSGGFSLIELMVAVLIGMVLIGAVTTMTVRQDAIRRTVTGANDVAMSSGFVSYALDRDLRAAGSGIAQGWRESYGCILRASKSAAQLLPRAAAWPAPFATVPTQVRVAPVLIHPGAGAGGSDVLAVMAGAGGLAELSASVITGSTTPTGLRVVNTIGITGKDLMLVARDGYGCMLQQVQTGFLGGVSTDLPLTGDYSASVIDGLQLEKMAQGAAAAARVALLGDTDGSRPRFRLYGVNTDQRLVMLDMLRLDGVDTPEVLAEGLLDMRFLYGVDGNSDGIVDTWVSPTAAGYRPDELTKAEYTAQVRLRNILAIRVGFIARGDVIERDVVSPSSVTLFPSLPDLAVRRDLTSEEQRLRVRAYESIVPLRNAILTGRKS